MSKWIAFPIIAVLVIVIGVGGYLYWDKKCCLDEAESEIVTLEGNIGDLEGNVLTLEGNVSSLEGNVTTLEANVSSLEGDVSTLETDLADSEATVSALYGDLDTANSTISDLQADVSTQQNINASLSAELNEVKDPRHFSSISELTDWLQQDDTDTRYADETTAEMATILQVRALRDGYIIYTFVISGGEGLNMAAVGDEMWAISPENDNLDFLGYINPLPSHPLPL